MWREMTLAEPSLPSNRHEKASAKMLRAEKTQIILFLLVFLLQLRNPCSLVNILDFSAVQ